jgi:hypothetical protein
MVVSSVDLRESEIRTEFTIIRYKMANIANSLQQTRLGSSFCIHGSICLRKRLVEIIYMKLILNIHKQLLVAVSVETLYILRFNTSAPIDTVGNFVKEVNCSNLCHTFTTDP